MWVSPRSFVFAEALPVEEAGENGRWEGAPGSTAGSTEADEHGRQSSCSDSTVSGGSSSERSQSSSNTDPALVLPGLLAPPQLLTRSRTKKPPVF